VALRDSQILNSLHPWLSARVQWIQTVAELVGGKIVLISGRRSLASQRQLYDTVVGRPVAFPGCSQHNYGFAVDADYQLIIQDRGRIPKAGAGVRIFSPAESTAFYNSLARHASLTLVANDDGHMQIYPGIQFREWAVSQRLCPQNPPEPAWFTRFKIQKAIEDQFGFNNEILNLLNLPRLGGS